MKKSVKFFGIILLVTIIIFSLFFWSRRDVATVPLESFFNYLVLPVEVRLKIRDYVLQKTHIGLEKMTRSAENNEPIPDDMLFLVDIAKNLYAESSTRNLRIFPEEFLSYLETFAANPMNSRAILGILDRDVFDLIETHYRNEIFRLFSTNMYEAFSLLGIENINHLSENVFEKSQLAFHIEDTDATRAFSDYFRANPTTTFDALGRLINPTILPSDVMILGNYRIDFYGLHEQELNVDGSLRFTAVKKEVKLDGNHIQSVHIEHWDGRPVITFMLDREGGEILYRFTSANINNILTVVLDDKVRARAIITVPIRGNAVTISGFSYQEALMFAQLFRAGDNQ